MALTVPPVVVFSSSSGSDASAASGAGPGTAVAGTAAAATNGSASITIADAVNLAGVAQDGSAVLYINTASGRKFTRISTVSGSSGNWTVTVEDTVWTAGSGLAWAIGGKRGTFNATANRQLFSDLKAGWAVETEDAQAMTGSAITIAVAGDTTSGLIEIRGAAAADHPAVSQSANANHFAVPGNVRFKNLKFTNSNATKTNAIALNISAAAGTIVAVEDCILGDATNKLLDGINRAGGGQPDVLVRDCDINNCTSHGLVYNSTGIVVVRGSRITLCGGSGISFTGAGRLVVEESLVTLNTAAGITMTSGGGRALAVARSVIHANGADGIDISSSALASLGLAINACNITGNGTGGTGVGIRGHSLTDKLKSSVDYNNYGTGSTANASGATSNITVGTRDLTVDPGYADAANGNFECGTNVRAKGWPDATRTIGANQSMTNTFIDIGAQREEPAAAGPGYYAY